MFRKYDFLSMEIFDLSGKRLGTVSDICFDFNKKRVVGFEVESSFPFKKMSFIGDGDVVYFNENLVARGFDEKRGISMKYVNNMDIYNLEGQIIGIVCDVLISQDLEIIAFVISSGILKDIFDGRRIISVKNIILGEENIIYFGNENIKFKNHIHI